MQNAILSGKQFELYADCERLIPSDIRPVADKKELVIEPFDPEHMGLGRKSVATGRRKRDEADNIDIFEAGFQKASGGKIDSKAVKVQVKAKRDVSSEPVAILEEPGFLTAAERENTNMKGSALLSIEGTLPTRLRQHPLPRKVPPVAPVSKRMMGTSARSALLYDALRAGQELCADSDKHKAWEIQTYSIFRCSNVVWWREAKVGSGRDKSYRQLGPATQTLEQPSISVPDSRAPVSSGKAPVGSVAMSDSQYDDDSDDDLPDLPSLGYGKATSVPSVSIRSTSLKGQRSGQASSRASEAVAISPERRHQDSEAGKAKLSAETDYTVISIDDSDDESGVLISPLKTKKSVTAANTRQARKPSQASMDLEDSFDDDLDSSVWLAIDLDPQKHTCPAVTEVDEQTRPDSPKLATIVCRTSLFLKAYI